MGLFKSEEEKAEERQSALRTQAAAEKREQRLADIEAAHASALPRYEYRVIDVGAGGLTDDLREKSQAQLNRLAGSGWRVITSTYLHDDFNAYFRLLMERPAMGSGHLGPPVRTRTVEAGSGARGSERVA